MTPKRSTPKKADVRPKVKRRKIDNNASLSVPCELTEAVKTRNVVITTVILESYDDVSPDLAEKLLHQVFHNVNGDLESQDAIVEILGLLLDVPVNVNLKNSEGQTVLQLAVENRMIQVIKFLICRGADFVSDDKLLHRLFHNVNGDLKLQDKIIEILELFIKDPMNVNITNDEGHTILHLAFENRMMQVIEFLISRGADPKVLDKSGQSLLQFTIKNEYLRMRAQMAVQNADKVRDIAEEGRKFVEWMVRRNLSADLNIKNESNYTNLYLAVETRVKELIAFMSIFGAKWSNADGSTVLHFFIHSEHRRITAIKKQDSTVLQTLQQNISLMDWMLSKKPELVDLKNPDGDTPLHLAAKCRMIHLLPSLLKHTGDVKIVDKSGRTALQLFVDLIVLAFPPFSSSFSSQAEKICDAFVRKGFSVDVSDEKDNTPLHYMLHGGKLNCVKLLLNHTKNVDARDEKRNTALNLIMNYTQDQEFQEIDEELVRTLLSKGANVHKLNEYGISPLVAAVANKKLNMLRIFKEHEEDFCYSYDGGNLLHRFVESNFQTSAETDDAILDLLIDEGCEVNAKDKDGMFPLHLAVQQGKIKIAYKLIISGASVNSQESDRGYCPLHVAVEYDHQNFLTLLIQNGADVNATTFMGQTALHLDIQGYVVSTLINKGAWVDVSDKNDYLPLHTAILHRNSLVIENLIELGADINDNAHVLRKKDYLSASACISEHLIKLRAAGMPIDEKLECVLVQRPADNDFDEIHEDCLIELEKLKNYKIDHWRSLYDFLHMNRNCMCVHIKNKKIEELIESPTFVDEFPMYHTLISSAYHMADKRRTMLGPAKEAWLELTGIGMPDLCLHEIFNHVGNATLRSMIEGVKN